MNSTCALGGLAGGALADGAADGAAADGALLAFAEGRVDGSMDWGDIDLVMSNAVNGTVSLELKDASLKETLDAISDIAGLEYFVSGDIVTVSTLAELLERQKQREEFEAAGIQPVPTAHEVLVVELDYVDASRVLPVIE